MVDPQEYTITVKKIVLDGDTWFEATVAELPDVAEYGNNVEEVYELAMDTIQTAMKTFAQEGLSFPPPLPCQKAGEENNYVFLQLPNSLYRDITMAAMQEQMEINEYILFVLSSLKKRKNVPWVPWNHGTSLARLETKQVIKPKRSRNTKLGIVKT